MRVGFLITKSVVGGAQRFTLEQAQILKESGAEIFLVSNAEGWLVKKMRIVISAMLLHSGIERKFSIFFWIALIRFVRKNQLQILVCSSANAGVYGRICAFISGVPVIYVTHGWSSVYNGGRLSFLYNTIERLLSSISSSILCISENDRQLAVNVLKILPSKCHVIPNAIQPPSIPAGFKERKQNYSVLCVCRLEHPKLPYLLADSIVSLSDCHLTIIGGGALYAGLKEYVSEKAIANISLLGEIEGFALYRDYDIFCLISESEGMPISAIEAMSNGLALILSDVGGCPELIRGNGKVVGNDVRSIREAITYCCMNLEKCSVNSIELFNKQFNLQNMKTTYLEYYYSFLKP